MGKLQLKISGKDFTGLLANQPVIKDQLKACCRTLTFELSLQKNHLDLLGLTAELYYNSKRWFIGEIRKQRDTNTGKTSVTVYDPLFLFGKHDDDYTFKNQTATKIATALTKKVGIKVYKIAKTKVVLGYLIYKKGSPDKIMVDALARTYNAGGEKYWYRYNPEHDGFHLAERKIPKEIWVFKTGVNLVSASMERSTEEMYNTVKLINRETGKTVTKVNAENKAKYGNSQYYEEISDKNTNLSTYAKKKLKALSKISTTMAVGGINSNAKMGQFFVGDPIYVEEKNTGIVGGYWITNVTHTFLANDAIQLDFDVVKTEDIPEVQYEDKEVKKCMGRTTTSVHCRTSAKSSSKSKCVWPKGTDLVIEGKEGDWYKVSGTLKKKALKGYSHKSYVKIIQGKVPKS